MNQKQLEAAIRRVSNDPTLEPQVCSSQTVYLAVGIVFGLALKPEVCLDVCGN